MTSLKKSVIDILPDHNYGNGDSITPPVGSITGTEKGTGARFNSGKIPYEVLPLRHILESLGWHHADLSEPQCILYCLSLWYDGDDDMLIDAIDTSSDGRVQGFAGAAQVFKHVTERPIEPYPMWNWIRGMKWSVPYGCAIRHLLAEIDGIELDLDTGLRHRYHTDCNLLMLSLYAQTYPEGDDRPPKQFLTKGE